jgi:hypothetical protein
MFIVEDPPVEVKREWVMFIVEDPPVEVKRVWVMFLLKILLLPSLLLQEDL